jgi:hypothetical protein
LTFSKIREDLDKLFASKHEWPDEILAVCGGEVGATVRDRCERHAEKRGIKLFALWSGVDFEERLRRDTPELVRRFVGGEPFPETASDLADFARSVAAPAELEFLYFNEISPPKKLGRWRIGELLGSGGFGVHIEGSCRGPCRIRLLPISSLWQGA